MPCRPDPQTRAAARAVSGPLGKLFGAYSYSATAMLATNVRTASQYLC
jgi:hypothetical protein